MAAVTGNADISRGFTDGEVEESVSRRLRRQATGNSSIQFSTTVFPFPVVRNLRLLATLFFKLAISKNLKFDGGISMFSVIVRQIFFLRPYCYFMLSRFSAKISMISTTLSKM